jgi:hypothetical protein
MVVVYSPNAQLKQFWCNWMWNCCNMFLKRYHSNMFYPALVLFEEANCIDWIYFLLYTVTDRNIAFLVPLPHVTCWVLRIIIVNPVHFLLRENIKMGKSRDNNIILLFNQKYKCQWINVNFLQDKHNINAVS